MSDDDRIRWDEKYTVRVPAVTDLPPSAPPVTFAAFADAFPAAGHALDLACGQGEGAVWLAGRGMRVWGVDVSPVAIGRARDLARRSGVGDRCRFSVVDLDGGLPGGPPVDVVLCHRFRDRRLDGPIMRRLAPGGLLAIAALSRVGAVSGAYRAEPGELPAAFGDLDVIACGEGDGQAWLLARRPLR